MAERFRIHVRQHNGDNCFVLEDLSTGEVFRHAFWDVQDVIFLHEHAEKQSFLWYLLAPCMGKHRKLVLDKGDGMPIIVAWPSRKG